MGNIIIIDRKHKRANVDNQWKDPLGTEEAKREKARTIEIPKGSKNPIHQVLASMGAKALIGRKGFFFNDKKDMICGKITDVIPPAYVVLKGRGVFKFDDCISIGG